MPQHARLRTPAGVGVGGGGGHGRDFAEEDGPPLRRRRTAADKAVQEIRFFGIARSADGRNVKRLILSLINKKALKIKGSTVFNFTRVAVILSKLVNIKWGNPNRKSVK